MRWDEISGTLCPIARSLSVVGDRWTLLILRELGMGVRRFEEVQAQTGMSSHLLATRLKRLEKDGIVEWQIYSAHPVRYEYYATTKGKELDAVLLALQIWGEKWGGFDSRAESPITLIDKESGRPLDYRRPAPDDGSPFTFEDYEFRLSPSLKAEREARRQAFTMGKQQARTAKR
jgi:DNA-binding HxlR family transcriptional regulator